ncbi:HEPN/Toprim-associated domain-containing protein [Aminobacter sp. MSH1]|uniref:HEPN/Toprim-associated domain-containing protein n=1 Tax=Aminobacter sp. MSH1 TaxID=374606 RepID=UPI000D3C2B23|nr:HEPN/Toprim-associated domain-containing protein [Aminobacter sp. MSH1]
MIHLTLGRIELDWGKNGGFQNHSALFRPSDLIEIPYFYAADENDAESAALPLIRRSDTFSYRLITEMKEGYSAPLRTVDDDDVSGLSAYTIIRLLADNPCAQDLPVTWQFADVADGGWAPRESFNAPVRQGSRFLIVTEGTSDVQIIKHALALLAPDLADFFDFVDMRENYPFSGTGNLYNFVRGLISIRIQNNVVIIFDNDAEGVYNWERSTRLNRLENMRIVKLPDRSAFKQFRTLGPTGEHLADINGKAAAIECYLDAGSEPVVRWTSYDPKRDCYQGLVESKEAIASQFLRQKKLEPGYDYSGLESILTMLISECVSITEAAAKAALEAERPDG